MPTLLAAPPAPPTAGSLAGRLDLERLFDTYGMTPLPLSRGRVPLDLLRAYDNWCDLCRSAPDLDQEPWLPVGAVGPLLILGHYAPPDGQPALLPPWASGRALIDEPVYRKIANDLRDSRRQGLRHNYEPPSHRGLPESLPALADDRAALQFLLDYFILEPGTKAVARAAIERKTPLAELSLGLREAVMFLRYRPAMVDVRFLDVPPELLALAPRTTRDYQGFCFRRTADAFFVAFSEIPPHAACDEFTAMFRAEVEDEHRRPIYFALTDPDQLKQVKQQTQTAELRINSPVVESASFTQAVEFRLTTDAVRRIDPDRLGTTDEQLVHWVIGQAIMANAQDLHVMFERNSGIFRISKDGVLQTLYSFSEQRWGMVIGILRDLSKISGPFFQAISSRFSVLFDGAPVDFRVEATPFRDFERPQNMSLRLRRMDSRIRTLGDLAMNESDLKQLRRLISRPDGMILFTGPTCHGKSTTIYAALNELNRPEVKIMTAEDPIEQLLEGAHQGQVDTVKGLTFATLLRSFLRSAPNIILVGEIRDPETAEMAVGASHTGHLVFSTLHVRSAAAVPTRLADLKIPPGMVADTLIAAQSQRLIRTLCPMCKVAVKIPSAKESIFVEAGLEPPQTLYSPGSDHKCSRCQGRGYHGMTAVMELLEPDEEVFELIRREAGMRAISAAAERKGFKPLRVQALSRVADGATSLEEVQRKVLFTLG